MSGGGTSPLRRLYGRRSARKLRPGRARLLTEELGRVAVPDAGALTAASLFGPDCRRLWLEIGFGGGEHLAEQAARHPQALMIGCEPFLNGVGSALRHVEERGLTNVRIHAGDAREVLAALPDASLDQVMILFPDPWPKGRHHKRRLVQDETAREFARVLKPGGRLRFVTDWKDYADWALERFLRTPGLLWGAERADDWRQAPADHVETRYEAKKLGDTPPIFLEFVRA